MLKRGSRWVDSCGVMRTISAASDWRVPRPGYVEEALARVPGDVTIKGMFIDGLLDLAKARGVALDVDVALQRRRPTFKDEPMVDFMRLAVAVAQAAWPERSLVEGLKEVGRQTYRTFLTSLTGRVVFGILGEDINKLISATTKAYAASQSHGRAEVIESSATHCVLEYRFLYQFLDSLEVGVVEEAVNSCGLSAEIRMELTSPVSGRMHISFSRRQ